MSSASSTAGPSWSPFDGTISPAAILASLNAERGARFESPWWQAPWLITTVAAAVLVLLLVVMTLRCKDHTPRRLAPNPTALAGSSSSTSMMPLLLASAPQQPSSSPYVGMMTAPSTGTSSSSAAAAVDVGAQQHGAGGNGAAPTMGIVVVPHCTSSAAAHHSPHVSPSATDGTTTMSVAISGSQGDDAAAILKRNPLLGHQQQ